MNKTVPLVIGCPIDRCQYILLSACNFQPAPLPIDLGIIIDLNGHIGLTVKNILFKLSYTTILMKVITMDLAYNLISRDCTDPTG